MPAVALKPPPITAYPLCWPEDWPRTRQRFPARPKLSFRAVRETLLETLYRLDADDAVISCNLPLEATVSPMLRVYRPEDPGVAVYFQLLGGHWVIPCDRWDSVRANIQGINQALLALETVAHTGVSDALRRALWGFAVYLEPEPELAEPPPGPDNWLRLLGLRPDFTREQLEEAYWYLRHAYHPDRGGDEEIFMGLREARRQAMQYLQRRDRESSVG